jgi:hypothetical protein
MNSGLGETSPQGHVFHLSESRYITTCIHVHNDIWARLRAEAHQAGLCSWMVELRTYTKRLSRVLLAIVSCTV